MKISINKSFLTNEKIKTISKILINRNIDIKNNLEGPKKSQITFWNEISEKLFNDFSYETMYLFWKWWTRDTHKFKSRITGCIESLKTEIDKKETFSIDINIKDWIKAKKFLLENNKRKVFGADFQSKFLMLKLNKINNYCTPRNIYNYFNKDGKEWKGKYKCGNYKKCNCTLHCYLNEKNVKNKSFYELRILLENQSSCVGMPLRISGKTRKSLYLDLEANGTYNVQNKFFLKKSKQIPSLQTFKNILFENRHKYRLSSNVILDAIGSCLLDKNEEFIQNIGLNPFGALFVSKYQVIFYSSGHYKKLKRDLRFERSFINWLSRVKREYFNIGFSFDYFLDPLGPLFKIMNYNLSMSFYSIKIFCVFS